MKPFFENLTWLFKHTSCTESYFTGNCKYHRTHDFMTSHVDLQH